MDTAVTADGGSDPEIEQGLGLGAEQAHLQGIPLHWPAPRVCAVVLPSGGSALLVRYGDRLVGRRAPERPTDIIDDRIPASFAHVDYFPEAARQSASYVQQSSGAVPRDFSRMIIAQTWRAVSGAPQDVPLAICDRRTLDDTDISPRTGVLAPENSEGLADPRFTVGGI